MGYLMVSEMNNCSVHNKLQVASCKLWLYRVCKSCKVERGRGEIVSLARPLVCCEDAREFVCFHLDLSNLIKT